MLLNRSWQPAVEHPDGAHSSLKFRVMQWNTLADALSPSSAEENFIRCPQSVLAWDNRKEQLLEEIKRVAADVVCLEEVDHFHDFLEPQLAALGYQGSFLPKTSSPCLNVAGNNGPDGCALFFRKTMFHLESERHMKLLDAEKKPTSQVALVQVLSFVGTGKGADSATSTSVCVVVTHFKSKPQNAPLRVSQGESLLKEVALVAGTGGTMPTVICGDFNADPDERVCELFSRHEPPYTSVYTNAANDFTTWKFRPNVEACHTIDYVWFSSKSLRLDSRLALANKHDFGQDGLPCAAYPSDHLALACDLCVAHSD